MTDPVMTDEQRRDAAETAAVFLAAGDAHAAHDHARAADLLCEFVADPKTGPSNMRALAVVAVVITGAAVRKRCGPSRSVAADRFWMIESLPGADHKPGCPAVLAAIQALSGWLNDPNGTDFPAVWAHFEVAGYDGLWDIIANLVMIYAAVKP